MSRPLCNRFAIGLLAVAAVTTLATVSQAAIQFDLRAIPTGTTGAIVNNPKHVLPTASSGVVELQLWAMVTNADANNANDGFRATHLSLLSTPGQVNLPGNLAATSNVAPFNAHEKGDGSIIFVFARTTASSDYPGATHSPNYAP